MSGLSIAIKPISTWGEWKLFLRKNILTLMIPFLLWSLIYCNFNYENVWHIFYGSWQSLCTAETLSSLWYLSSFFCAKIISQLVINLYAKFHKDQIGIFILHKPVMQQVFIPFLQKMFSEYCSEGVIRFIGACLALIFSLILCRFIEYYIPELVGIMKKEVIMGTKDNNP